ncbi:MAG: DUF2827 family protein [Caulobacterales bacterium]
MGLRIGLTVLGHLPEQPIRLDAALWSSGLVQNIIFLAMLLQRLPQIETVALIAGPQGASEHPLAQSFGLACVEEAACAGQFDIVIETGKRLQPQNARALRCAGAKVVSYMAGNVMALNLEGVACHVPHGEILSEHGYDAVWITPQHWEMNRAYARLTRSDAVFEAPHIWAPDLLLQSAQHLARRLFWRQPATETPIRIGVFDPNVNVLKTFHWPLLASEEAYRARPEAIDRVLLFSATHLRELSHFKEFCGAMDLFSAGKLFVEERYPLAEMLGAHIDLVVTHHWQNGLNYLYWDVLYAGYPLVHNASAIADIGYYYTDFDPQDGGRAILRAVESHAETFERDRPKVLEALWQRHIDNPANQRRYSELIGAVMG